MTVERTEGAALSGLLTVTIARRLAELRADSVLILAALDGYIAEVVCAAPRCVYPAGRASFDVKGVKSRSPWAPSADRYPIAGRDGGAYEPTNVRLTHFRCNQVAGGHLGGSRAVLTHKKSGFFQSAVWREASRVGGQRGKPGSRSVTDGTH